jgi:hypothetical protein
MGVMGKKAVSKKVEGRRWQRDGTAARLSRERFDLRLGFGGVPLRTQKLTSGNGIPVTMEKRNKRSF